MAGQDGVLGFAGFRKDSTCVAKATTAEQVAPRLAVGASLSLGYSRQDLLQRRLVWDLFPLSQLGFSKPDIFQDFRPLEWLVVQSLLQFIH